VLFRTNSDDVIALQQLAVGWTTPSISDYSKDVCSDCSVRVGSGAQKASDLWVPGVRFPGVKWPEGESNYSHSSSAEINNTPSMSSVPNV